MTHDDPRDLSDLLRDLADDAARAPRGRSLEGMAATARTHGLAARRRRTAARSLVAAASVAVVAVGGVLVAQNLGGTTTPPPATATTLTCGTPFTAPTGTRDDLTLVPVDGDGPFTAASLADLPAVAAVLAAGSAAASEQLGSTGYVSYTVVRDGLAVASGGAMPEPWTEVELTAGDPPGAAFARTAPVPCDGGDTLPAGDYEVWATLDGSLLEPSDARTPVTVVGGPWTVTLGAPHLTMATEAFACGSESLPGMAGSATPTYRLEATGPAGPVAASGTLPGLLRLDPAVLDGSTQARTVMGVRTYLARGGRIVATHQTQGDDMLAWFGPAGATGVMPGTTQVDDGLRVDGSANACDGTGLLPPGDYEAWATLELASDDGSGRGRTLIASEAVPVTLVAASGTGSDEPGSMLTCGDPTAEITSSTTAGGDAVTLTLDGTLTHVAPGTVTTGAVTAQVHHAQSATGVLEGGPVETYLLRDEIVVAATTTPQDGGTWWTAPDAPAGDASFRDELSADLTTTACDGTPLPDGTYTLLVVVPVTVPESGEPGHELVAPRQDVVVGSGPALPAADPSAVFPACGAPVPGYQGAPYELTTLGDGAPVTPTGHEDSDGTWLAHTTLVSSDDVAQEVSFGPARGVLTKDGRVVGRVLDADVVGGPGYPASAPLGGGRSADVPVSVPLSSCGGDGSLPGGTYEVWATLDVTGTSPAHPATTVVSRVASLDLRE